VGHASLVLREMLPRARPRMLPRVRPKMRQRRRSFPCDRPMSRRSRRRELGPWTGESAVGEGLLIPRWGSRVVKDVMCRPGWNSRSTSVGLRSCFFRRQYGVARRRHSWPRLFPQHMSARASRPLARTAILRPLQYKLKDQQIALVFHLRRRVRTRIWSKVGCSGSHKCPGLTYQAGTLRLPSLWLYHFEPTLGGGQRGSPALSKCAAGFFHPDGDHPSPPSNRPAPPRVSG